MNKGRHQEHQQRRDDVITEARGILTTVLDRCVTLAEAVLTTEKYL